MRALALVFIIILAGILRQIHVFQKGDFRIVSKIVLNVTLPAAVVIGFSSSLPQPRFLLFTFLGFSLNCVMLFISWVCSRKKEFSYRAVWLNITAGYNIGAFVLPFVQSLLGPGSLVACCLFDAGGSLMCNGGTYTTASFILDKSQRRSLKNIIQRLCSSVPFDCYLCMMIISVLGLRLPDVLLSLLQPVAQANSFAAMFVIGLMLEIDFPKDALREVCRITSVRVMCAAIFAAIIYWINPFGEGKVIAMAAFAPVSVTCTGNAERSGGDYRVTACVNSLTILISIVAISLILVFA